MSANNQVAPTPQTPQVPQTKSSPSERFTNAVMNQFSSDNGSIELTCFQKKLIQNYFIKVDDILRAAEAKRLKKAEKYREKLAYTWENIDMRSLAVSVIAFSSVGLDTLQANQVHPIPYKNDALGKYDIGFIIGYNGLEIKGRKYGLDVPDNVIIEVVYSSDKFKQYKKDKNNPYDSYEFEIVNDFNRGEIVGGFYYKEYINHPEKNVIKSFSMKDIDKRKPDYASAEFWGGQKDNWEWSEEKGKNVKNGTVEVEGWKDEMVYKTIKRAAWNNVVIDSEKIDSHYMTIIQSEQRAKDLNLQLEIEKNAHKTEEGFTDAELVPEDTKSTEPIPVQTIQSQQPVAQTQNANTQATSQQTISGPGF